MSKPVYSVDCYSGQGEDLALMYILCTLADSPEEAIENVKTFFEDLKHSEEEDQDLFHAEYIDDITRYEPELLELTTMFTHPGNHIHVDDRRILRDILRKLPDDPDSDTYESVQRLKLKFRIRR